MKPPEPMSVVRVRNATRIVAHAVAERRPEQTEEDFTKLRRFAASRRKAARRILRAAGGKVGR